MKSTIWIAGGGAAAMLLLGTTSAHAFGKNPATSGVAGVGICGTPEPTGTCARVDNSGPQPRRTVYLNRHGGTYAPAGDSNSATNQVALDNFAGGTIAPLSLDDTNWAGVVQCVKDFYAPYNIDITDVEPDASTSYLEAVVGGTEANVGLDAHLPPGNTLLGIAATNELGNGCDVEERGICFAFADNHGSLADATNRKELCITIAHETGHLLGLEHEVHAADLMSYEINNHTKSFSNFDSACGTYEDMPGNCICGASSTQNTDVVLLENAGPNEKVPPVVTIKSPAPGATVGPGFVVEAEATDDHHVASVELVIGGQVVASAQLPPYNLKAPLSVAVGDLSYEVRAYDKSSNKAVATSTVKVEPGCTGPADCESNEQCKNGACLGDVGHTCTSAANCADGLCIPPAGAGLNDSKFCTRTCDDSSACPSGFACDDSTGGATKCNPTDGAGGCGCSAGRQRNTAGLSALAMFGLVTLLARRRRGAPRS
jgi:MYXO-CTERM domain-containing protein